MFKRDRQRARLSLDIPCITTKCTAALVKQATKKVIRARVLPELGEFRTRTRIALTSSFRQWGFHGVQKVIHPA
jgi:hypothetical protein